MNNNNQLLIRAPIIFQFIESKFEFLTVQYLDKWKLWKISIQYTSDNSEKPKQALSRCMSVSNNHRRVFIRLSREKGGPNAMQLYTKRTDIQLRCNTGQLPFGCSRSFNMAVVCMMCFHRFSRVNGWNESDEIFKKPGWYI